MEKFCTYATIATLHLFKQAIWEHMWKHTFKEMTNMQLMWLCIFSSRRCEETCENKNFKKSYMHIMWLMWLFKQAIWEDMCNITFQKIAHMQLMWLCIHSSRRFEETCEKLTFQKTYMTLHLFKQVIWEDICNLTFGKIEVGCGGLRALQKVPKRALVRVVFWEGR